MKVFVTPTSLLFILRGVSYHSTNHDELTIGKFSPFQEQTMNEESFIYFMQGHRIQSPWIQSCSNRGFIARVFVLITKQRFGEYRFPNVKQ